MPYILALDQGTTSSRAIVFDHTGRLCSLSQQEFTQHFPKPGWVEHDPMEIWYTQLHTAQEAIRKAGLNARDIAALGVTNQRETTVVWDKATGSPLYNAIVWQDRRTADYCQQLKDQHLEPQFQKSTGLRLDPYFSGTKLRWILDHIPGARLQAARGTLAFGTIDTWLLWNLTGQHITDASNASRTLLYNLHTGDWDDEILEVLNIPRAVLPRVRPSSEFYGATRSGLFEAPIPVAGIAGDQQAALFGQACLLPGMVKNTYGTGCFMLLNTGQKPVPSKHNLLTTVAWKLGRETTYALEGSVFVAGAVVQWLRDGLGLIQHSGDVEALASGVPDNGGVYFVPAFTGLGAPYWNPYARGLITGLTRGTTAAHLARAALESIAFQTDDVLQAMKGDAGINLTEIRVDGGASANNHLMQFQADLLGVPVVRPTVLETTALGAACLAGLAVGIWSSLVDIAALWSSERRFTQEMPAPQVAALREGWKKAVERTL
jgi:glycerol kinase